MERAPIIVFAYKRPLQLKRMLDTLVANDLAIESNLIIFCDGPKPGCSERDLAGIEKVREISNATSGFARVNVVEAKENKGLARSVIDGVTQVVNEHGRTIVVEDDAVLSPYFLRFMNDALDLYVTNEKVYSVGSWNYYADPSMLSDTYFIRYPDSLAWATWKRSWDLFEKDGAKLLGQLKERKLLERLDADGNVSYFSQMLKEQVKGNIDSWAIRWTVNCILQGKLNIFPHTSLALNKGLGDDATHEKGEALYYKDLELAKAPIPVQSIPVDENAVAFESWARFVQLNFEGLGDTSLKARVWRVLPSGMTQWYTRQKRSEAATPTQLAFEPVSRVFGFDRGTPVDRHYIEGFLGKNSALITGHAMEVQESTYTRKFGKYVSKAEVLRYSGDPEPLVRIGDLTRSETLPDSEVDVFICTQTLNFIYEHHKAVEGLHRSLKPGGHALVTVAGLVQISRTDADQWGDYWRYTEQSAARMFGTVFGEGNVEVEAFGNSYAAACLLKGFATEECNPDLLERTDPDYPVVITIKARKSA